MNANHTDDRKEKQKPYQPSDAGSGKNESPSKVEDLTKAGRKNFDPNEGSD
ncbi:hypothetical protein QP166_12875 [Sphingomonas sp. LR60]|uniref:hypothetical protein n=1 Tax=Sphingomonas sp. LR60 TaxID=3050233 RepID=UPI002FE29AB8